MMFSQSHLTFSQRLDWLRLIRSENVGPVTFFRLLERFGTPTAALQAIADLAQRGGRSKPIKVCSKAAAEREILAAEEVGATLLCACEPEFSGLLSTTEGAPPCLYVKGHVSLFQRPCIAIVGARNASAAGRQFAQGLAKGLGSNGVVVASGLARGIDAAVHEGSLATGTVAVLAGGVDVIYPAENTGLYHAIAESGLLVSEMPPGTEPQARHFPRRNRIVSGLSQGVVVIEATPRSGSLITARYAAEQGRDVFAVPGSPLDPRAEGPNALIREGAILCRGVQDIMDHLNGLQTPRLWEDGRTFVGTTPSLPSESTVASARSLVRDSLSMAPVEVDEILRQCQLSPSVASVVLLELELAGRLERHPGNRVSLLSGR